MLPDESLGRDDELRESEGQMTDSANATYIAQNYDIMAWEAQNDSERHQLQQRADRFYRIAKIEADKEVAVPFHYQEV
jgi:hypothetical protein